MDIFHSVKLRVQAFWLRSQGFTGRAARTWTRQVDADLHTKDGFSRSEKIQAYSWGYMPEDILNFHITEENKDKFISEKDYLYLHPINGKYDKWIRDRVSALNVFGSYRSNFETVHFHIVRRGGKPFIFRITKESGNYEPNTQGIHKFLAKHGSLYVSSADWSKSCQWKVEAWGDNFKVDGVEITDDEFYEWLECLTQTITLVLLEKAPAEPFSAEQVPAGNLSLIARVLNRDGQNPYVAQAFLLLATNASELGEDKSIHEFSFNGSEDLDAQEEDFSAGKTPSGIQQQLSKRRSFATSEVSLVVAELAQEKDVDNHFYVSEVAANGSFNGLKTLVGGKIESLTCAPGSQVPFEGAIPYWEEIKSQLRIMCKQIPQVEFAEFELSFTKQGFVITGIHAFPPYNRVIPFSDDITNFLHDRIQSKHEVFSGFVVRRKRFFHNLSLRIRRTFAKIVAPKGLVPYQSTRWIHDVWADLVSRNGLSLSTKFWAYKHGFLSYRIPQYGITPDNWRDYISDFEYRWLRHINTKYKYWLEDKITLKYIASDFNECFPEYYYYTSLKNGENRVVPMMDLPDGYEATFADILRFAKEKGVLALKPDEGSHGEGFYKLTWSEEEGFALNNNKVSESDVLTVLEDQNNQYLITEYIHMHPQLAEIYPGSVNTIRVTVFKRDGRTPQIGNAYMRIGSSKTGAVDNVAAGGIVASVDIETGRYGDAKILDGVDQGNLVDSPIHPDTGILIEGILPNWNLAKTKILDIASAIPQLEYFGFDLAITPDGIKLPEINRFPDFPRIAKLTPQTIEYLLYRLEKKKRVYHYDKQPCRKLLRLPRR